jgi:hypothetical protein
VIGKATKTRGHAFMFLSEKGHGRDGAERSDSAIIVYKNVISEVNVKTTFCLAHQP